MFDQSLNLLPQRFRKVHVPFDFYKIFIVIGFVIIGVMIMVGAIKILNDQLDEELTKVKNRIVQIDQDIQSFKANNQKNIFDETIAVRIKKYEKILRQRQTFLNKLNGKNFGNTQGFSEYLLALARQNFPDLWIEELVIQGNASVFGLKGKAVSPTDITLYLQSLQDEPAMNGILFDHLDLVREHHPEGNFVSFSISHGHLSGGTVFESEVSSALANTVFYNTCVECL